MSAGFGEVPSPFTATDNSPASGDPGDFECNICFDLAQDPILTLCGHLFCWPCLYKWLHIHSLSQECPVCKAEIEQEKLVPLYGRGKNSTDPRSKSVPGVEIPHRPAGQRPATATAPAPDRNLFGQNAFGWGPFGPVMTSSFGNFNLSIGGFIPSLFGFQMHAFTGQAVFGNGAHRAPGPGPARGFPYGSHHAHGVPQRAQNYETGLSAASPLLLIGLLFLLALIWN